MSIPERIVVIDDSANDVQVIRRFLQRKGYAVDAATSGEEGLAMAKRIPPDVFVVDYRMPGIDGFEVTRRIKSDSQLRTIPVLLLTGADSASAVVDGLGAGADDFVRKSSCRRAAFADRGSRFAPRTCQARRCRAIFMTISFKAT